MGLMATVGIPDDASEWEVRNAISRAYYAVFHMCHAWFSASACGQASEHLTCTGRSMWSSVRFWQRLAHFHSLRKDADYNPRMVEAKEYQGSLDTFRIRANASSAR